MKTRKSVVVAVIAFIVIAAVSMQARADDPIIDATCDTLIKEDIPVSSYQDDFAMPEDNLSINQSYNTSYDDGFWSDGKWMYGHDGLDTEGASDTPGVNDVYAMFPGVVVLSKNMGRHKSWGESLIIATRMNSASEEILTHHYHHLHATGEGSTYETTRLFNACDEVAGGEVIAKEGTTGFSNGSHLHISIRRWANITKLNEAIEAGGRDLFGYGYTYGNNTKLVGNLNPEGFIYRTFDDYHWGGGVEPPAYAWSYPYILKMRDEGVDFGLYDGRYGAGEHVSRRQAARWVKIAAGLISSNPSVPTFTDVPATDPDFPYIEMLVRFPSEHSVLNPGHTCVTGEHKFCPDSEIKRAEALKMVIMGFYGNEFMQAYDNTIWRQTYETALHLLDIFMDVPAVAWYAPYIHFGVSRGIVTEQNHFYPFESIKKEELAKWIAMGMDNLGVLKNGICWNVVCPEGRYCATNGAGCAEIPSCVPSESQECEVGGGYEGPPDPPDPTCQQGQTQCGADCCDTGETCENGLCVYPQACPAPLFECGVNCCNQGEICENGFCVQPQTCPCTSGICCDGCNFRPASDVCDQWYEYRCEGSNPGQNAQRGTVRKYCTGQSTFCDGQQQTGWQTLEDCSTAQVCEMNNGMPECVGNCTDTYIADSNSACYGNPQGTGTPTLCLEVEKNSGSSFKYRICKGSGTYQNDFTYRLKDDNNMVNFTQYNGSAGATCTPWKDFSVSYVTAYGNVNGAGLNAEVISPSGCTDSACKYRTGTVTVSKQCI